MLSLFIIKEFGLEKQALPTIEWLSKYVNLEQALIDQIPQILDFLTTPFQDYHNSAVNYLLTLEILAEMQRPPTCEYYWAKGAAL